MAIGDRVVTIQSVESNQSITLIPPEGKYYLLNSVASTGSIDIYGYFDSGRIMGRNFIWSMESWDTGAVQLNNLNIPYSSANFPYLLNRSGSTANMSMMATEIPGPILAWYSPLAANNGTDIYQPADGEEVIITAIGSTYGFKMELHKSDSTLPLLIPHIGMIGSLDTNLYYGFELPLNDTMEIKFSNTHSQINTVSLFGYITKAV